MAGTELAKAYVQIVPSAKGIKGSLTSALSGEASAAGDSAGKTAGNSLGATIKRTIAAAGIGVALKNALSEGANLQQSLGGIETLFKDSADKVVSSAKEAYKTAGMSANEYMETVTSFSASLLQGLSGDTNKAADVADMALTDMSDNANKMGTSMELIQNAYQGFAKQNYTMLDNLKLGYGGTKTEMQRLLADAQAFSGVEYNIDNLADVYEAIHVIQGEMSISGRTAEEAAEIIERTGRSSADVYEQLGTTAKESASTFSGSLASMKAAATNLLGNLTLGESIGPSLSALGETVHTFVVGNLLPMTGNLLSSLPEVLNGAFSMAIEGLNFVADNSDALVENGIALIGELGNGILSAVPHLAEAAINLVSSFGTALINTDWLAVATGMLESLRDAISVGASEIFGADDTQVNAIFGSIIDGIPVAAQTIQDAFAAIWDVCNIVWNDVGQPIWDAVMETVQYVADNWGPISETIQSCFQTAWDACQTVWTNVGQPIWDMISFAVDEAAALFSENMPAIMEFFSGAIAGIQDTWEYHLKPIFEAIGKVLNDVVKPAFEVVFKTIIEPLVRTVFNAISRLWTGTLKPVFDGICDFLLGTFTGNWEKSLQGILDIVTGIFNGIRSAIETPMDLVKEIVNSAIDFIQEKFDFDWELPELKMPHISITGEWSFNPPKVPTFGIEWYAKAMNNPIIMNSPTAFGINSLGQVMAGGEAGSEIVSGTDTLMRMIAAVVAAQNQELLAVLYEMIEAISRMDENMGENLKKALEEMTWKINNRELARLVREVS